MTAIWDKGQNGNPGVSPPVMSVSSLVGASLLQELKWELREEKGFKLCKSSGQRPGLNHFLGLDKGAPEDVSGMNKSKGMGL